MSPALRRALLLALCCLLVGGCLSRGKKSAANKDTPAAPAADANRTAPGPVVVAGRVIAVDPRSLSVTIELAPYAVLPMGYNGHLLISRTDDLRPTARLQALPYVRGRMLAARMLAGTPRLGDEVVFAPDSP